MLLVIAAIGLVLAFSCSIALFAIAAIAEFGFAAEIDNSLFLAFVHVDPLVRLIYTLRVKKINVEINVITPFNGAWCNSALFYLFLHIFVSCRFVRAELICMNDFT